MRMEGGNNVVPMMTLPAIRITGEYKDTSIISILDFHAMTTIAKRREAQHISRLDWVCAFLLYKRKMKVKVMKKTAVTIKTAV